MEFKDFTSIHDMLSHTVERYPDKDAYRTILDDGSMESISWTEFAEQVRRVGKSLIALGVGKDDKVNIVSYSCYRWVLADVATASIGSVTVGIYHSLLAKDIGYIVNHSDAVLVFAEDLEQVAKLIDIRDATARRSGRSFSSRALPLRVTTGSSPSRTFSNSATSVADETLDARIADVEATDVAAIVYTSGTTGVPKGAVLTHDNITFTAQSVFGSAKIYPDDTALLFLPLAHIFARTCVFTALVLRLQHDLRPRHRHHRRRLQDRPPALVPERAANLREGPRQDPLRRERQGRRRPQTLQLGVRRRRPGQRPPARQGTHPVPHPAPVRARDQTRLFQGPGRPRRSGSLVHQRRRAPGSIHRQVLPRRGRAHPRGHRHDREHLLHQRQPGGQLPLRLGRTHRSRDRAEDRQTTARCSTAAATSCASTTRCPPRPPKPSPRTAGSTPAIWARSTTWASSRSPAARRTSSSPPAARTWRRRPSRASSRPRPTSRRSASSATGASTSPR